MSGRARARTRFVSLHRERRVNLCTECSGLSNWWPCWFRRARQDISPPPPPVVVAASREPLSRSSTPRAPLFLPPRRAVPCSETHVRKPRRAHTNARNDVWFQRRAGWPQRMLHCAQPLLATLYSSHLLHSQSYPPVSAPRCNPFGCSCSPPCNPPRRRLLLFPFFQFGLGGGKRATPSPLFSLHPPSTALYHPRGFLCLCRFSLLVCVAPALFSRRLCLSPGG